MKKTTLDNIQRAEHFVSRAVIDRKAKKMNAVLEEQRSITKLAEGNVLPAYLYNYYVSICQIPTWDLTNDSKIAKQLGISERKVADTRRFLTKHEWVRLDTHKHNGVTYGIWYIGKEVVQAKIGMNTTLEEFRDLGIILDEEYAAAKSFTSAEEFNED